MFKTDIALERSYLQLKAEWLRSTIASWHIQAHSVSEKYPIDLVVVSNIELETWATWSVAPGKAPSPSWRGWMIEPLWNKNNTEIKSIVAPLRLLWRIDVIDWYSDAMLGEWCPTFERSRFYFSSMLASNILSIRCSKRTSSWYKNRYNTYPTWC